MKRKWRNLVGIPLMGVALASTLGVTSYAADYYGAITNTSSGTSLASSLHTLSESKHTNQIGYSGLWTAYYTTDVLPGTGIIWDTYSEKLYTVGDDQDEGSHDAEGQKYNREHTVPQSWFTKASPMVADTHHILATDAYVNGQRSNWPYGEVGSAKYTSGNGSKLGSSKLSSYSGKVFEPIDEYKGDIARGYFYMAIRYSDKLANWGDGAEVAFTSSYPYLTSYALNLFTKRSHEDPVSDKEIIRNDAIEAVQGNRNPFIDHPEWIDTICTNSYTDSASNTKYSASNVVSAINTLTQSASNEDVYSAYAKYCRLNTSDKSLVTNVSTLFSLVESKANSSIDLDTYWPEIIARNTHDVTVDQTKVDNVIALINALPSPVTASDATAVNQANTAYNALNRSEKALVTNYAILEAALTTLDNLSKTPFTLVTNPSDLSVGDSVIIAAANYNYALGPTYSNYYREAVSIEMADNIIRLAEDSRVTVLTLAQGTTSNTFAFNTGDGYLVPTSDHKSLLTETTISVNSSYNISISSGIATIASSGSYTNGTMAFLKNSKYTDFTSNSTIDDSEYFSLQIYKHIVDDTINQEEVNTVINLINALPENITLSDEVSIVAAENAYGALNSSEKELVTNYSLLTQARSSLNTLRVIITSFENLTTKTSAKFSYSSQEETITGVEGYNIVTDASTLAAGDNIIITASSEDKALSTTQNPNNRGSVSITKSRTTLTYDSTSTPQIITLEAGTNANTFAFNVGDGYLYAASSSSNYLKTQSSKDDNASWAISITSSGVATITAQGANTSNILKYNTANSGIFACYSSGQIDVKIYKYSSGSTTTTTYSVSNAYIRFGGGMDKSLYENLLALDSNATFGVALSKNGTTYSYYTCNPVYVESIGATTSNVNGSYVQYSALIPVSEENYSTTIYAKCYVEINGTKYFMESASYSLHTLAQYYINIASTLGITDPTVLGALGEF
jgi:endonuclease I